MKVAIVKERRAHELRVAATPDSVKTMVGLGLEVVSKRRRKRRRPA
jgi:NAD(P) transhydrogenase subunit alpha